jgi:disulfide bond formation protein DsbB
MTYGQEAFAWLTLAFAGLVFLWITSLALEHIDHMFDCLKEDDDEDHTD